MKKKIKYIGVYRTLIRGLAAETILMIIAALLSYFFVRWAGHVLFKNQDATMSAGYGLGLIIPMAFVTGIINALSIRYAYSSFIPLLQGIEKIAAGDFSVRLSVDKHSFKNFLLPVYSNFNKMAAELGNIGILRNDFINSYSHEFKTPIASINGFANLMLRQDVSPEEQRQYLQIIADESKRLADLANDTLLLSWLDSQQIISDKKPYSLDEQLRKCIIMLSEGWNMKHQQFSGDLAETTYTGNEDLMQHLWLNLLGNAIKFTPDGGEITVSLFKVEEYAVVKISDTGAGMTAETQEHIFEKYYQGVPGKKQNGLGLGLNIAHRIVELCGGTISVQSRPDEGSTFTVELPL